MSQYQPRPGDFSLFRNDRKEKDTHPDYAGSGVLPDGTPAWINAWLKESRDGKKYFSISIKPKSGDGSFREAGGFKRQSVGGGGSGDLAGSDRDDPFGDSIPFATPYSIR